MAKIVRYNGDLQAFASNATSTNRTIFGDVTQSDTLDNNINADFYTGWEIVSPSEAPSKEDFNALGFTATQLIAYLHQVGIAEWNASQEYHQYSQCNYNGRLYVSTINNNVGNTPGTDANWTSGVTIDVDDKLILGSSDCEIYTDGSDTYIDNNTGNLIITASDVIINGDSVYTPGNFDIDTELPTQSGHSGEFLTTDGANSSWTAISAGGSPYKCVSFYYAGVAQDEDYVVIDTSSSNGFKFDESVTINSITIQARTAPTGTSIIMDLIKNEVELNLASKAVLSAGEYGEKSAITATAFTSSDRMGIIIKQVGSTLPGEGLNVIVHYTN